LNETIVAFINGVPACLNVLFYHTANQHSATMRVRSQGQVERAAR